MEHTRYKTIYCEDIPKNLRDDDVYIIGGKNDPFQAVLTCPRYRDHCDRIIHLNVSDEYPDEKSKWLMTEHKDGTISIDNSIIIKGCKHSCHFTFLENLLVILNV